MSLVRGKEMNLYVQKAGTFYPMGCAMEASFNLAQELVNVTTADSGVEDEFDFSSEGMTVDASGVVTFDQGSTFQFREFIANRRTKQRILIEFIDTNSNTYTLEMDVLIQNISSTGNVSDYALYDLQLVRSGAMIETYTPGPGGTPGGIGSMILGSTFIVG